MTINVENILKDLKFDDRGLIPVIAQDSRTDEVLMLAYMNREALEKTLETGLVTYWSRSRGKLWVKGETSGHYQIVKSISLDCDGDTLLIKCEQKGAACHTGNRTCFFRKFDGEDIKMKLQSLENGYGSESVDSFPNGSAKECANAPEGCSENTAQGAADKASEYEPGKSKVLQEVYNVIADRVVHPKEGSYTNYLFSKGLDKILKKVGEETAEVIIAAKNKSKDEICYEVADLFYHLFVLLVEQGVALDDIYDELEKRR